MPRKKRLPTPPEEEIIPSTESEESLPEDDFEEYETGAEGAFSAQVEALNDPEVEYLNDPPRIGGGRSSGEEDLYGNDAYAMGRAMSPRLYAQAAQFPTCSQLRVWKWENGVPVGLGAIDATATEEDMVRRFGSAMPKKGDGRAQFKLRPIDIRGKELGQEVTLIISEHHIAVQNLRDLEEDERDRRDIHVHGGSGGNGEAYGEMGRMFEQALETSESRSAVLQSTLEMERERIRVDDAQRAQERVDLATNAAQGVQALTERMMNDESQRSDRSMKMQTDQSNMLLTTLTGIFQQQQSMAHQSSEQQRRTDEFRLEQERQRADRERQATEDKGRGQQQDWDRKRQQEREESDGRLRLEREEAQRRFEQYRLDLDARLQREHADQERKERSSREDSERREKWMAEERSRRESREAEQSRTRDADRQRQHERMMKEVEISAQRDREHAERMMSLSKIEMSKSAQAGGMDVLGNAAGLLKQFGVEPNEILPRLFNQEEEDKGGGWLDALPKMLGAAAEFAKVNMQGKAQEQAQQAQIAAMQRPALPEPGLGPQNFPQGEMMYQMPPEAMAQMERDMALDQPSDEFEDEMEIQETPVQAHVRMLSEMAEEAGVPLVTQKNARVAIRKLVRKLKTTPQENWEGKIIAALQEELAIYHYIKAVTVRAAVQEGGSEPELTDAIVAVIQASSLVPDDVPVG
jgi:hypothetical protein